ncbi:proline dehydrogenase family protein [Natronolimnobius baerhuensis]|uniref:proline dehydrogenase n=1 Tax=Natronolimnobius baerhuensis TaxID=253108 RepID=A0A202EB96_9EURY|nr:proline dehydrogenase family protein [Natronolimnobius baerhuensis]OVE85514.1 proline dehydrogenase [Natronolimnobius baerhuensis]
MIPPIADRFVAGESAAEVLEHVSRLNGRNVGAIINLLGEHYGERPPVRSDAAEYRALAGDISRSNLDACLSVKPSQLGLDLGEDVFREELEGVVDAAAEHDVFVWIDMEDHTTTDATLDAFEALAHEYDGGVGVCVQANLKRTRTDLERLADVPGKIRFVKGAYDEPAAIAYTDSERVNREYEALLEYAFEHFHDGPTIAVGSHDDRMLERAIALHDEYGTDVEFQLLMGVREQRQYDLAAEYDVYQYVPYGGRWLSYFSRRVMERKENLRFALRAVLGR